MNKRMGLMVLGLCCAIFCSCSSQEEGEKNFAEKSALDISDSPQSSTVHDREAMYLNYSDYSGIWSEDGVSYEDIMRNGGAEFHVEISDNNELTGYIYVQQGLTGRMAEIENITGIIEDGKCYYSFSDDGWGNSGTLCIQFQQNEIVIEVQDFVLNDENRSGFGIDRTYVMLPMRERTEISSLEMETEGTGQASVLEAYDPSWSEERILEELENRKPYRENCSFYSEVVDYMENIREVRDISMYVEPLFATDTQRYTEEDFADVPPLIIHLAKNEIYARHGYLFSNEDLYNYFMGQLWYRPSIMKEEFDDSVFNECEIENIKLLANLDTY